MLIEEEKKIVLKNFRTKINKNDNLLLLIFEFCDINDFLCLSAVSKKFYELTKKMDNKFQEVIEKNYFSNYENYE